MTFADILHKYFGLTEGVHIWREFPQIDEERYGKPEDYGAKSWEDVDPFVDIPEVRAYWNNPWTDEGSKAWDRFTDLVDDMYEAGFISEDERRDIAHHACDISYDL